MKLQRAKGLLLSGFAMLFLLLLPLTVAHADSPPPPNYFYIYVSSDDANVKYVDVLIKMEKDNQYYSALNSASVSAHGFDSSAEIVAYEKDGYESVTFHCKNLHSEPSIYQPDLGFANYSKMILLDSSNTPISAVSDSIKVALIDKKGKILKVSDPVSVIPTDKNKFPRSVHYDAAKTTPTIEFDPFYHGYQNNNILISVPFLLAFLIRMILSTGIETAIAIPFKIRPLWKIAAVNIATQVLLFIIIINNTRSYNEAVIVGEILVFIVEFLAYIFLFKKVSIRKIAVYTVLANAVSLAIGLAFNALHLFVGQ